MTTDVYGASLPTRQAAYAPMVRSGNNLIVACVSTRPTRHVQTTVATVR